MVGKSKFFVLILVFMCSFVYSQTKLDSLIENAKRNSFELKQSRLNYLIALNRVNHKSSLYPASFTFDVLSNFTDSMNSIIQYPSAFSYKTSYLQKLPAGVSLGINLSYDYTRGVVDFFSDITSESIGYSQKPEINFVLTQSLRPYWALGERRNPENQLLFLSLDEQNINLNILEKEIVYNVTYYYIQYRKIKREINNNEKQIQFIKMFLEEIKFEYEKGNISKSEVWKKELELNDVVKVLNQNIEQLNLSKQILIQYCGFFEEINCDEDLPILDNEKIISDDKINLLFNQIKQTNLEYIVSKQSNAPKLKLSGSFSESTKTQMKFFPNYVDDKTSYDWSASIGFEFSELFSYKNRLLKRNYNLVMEGIKNDIENYIFSNGLKISKNENLIKLYKELKEKTNKIKDNYELYYTSIIEDYKNGNLSKIQVLESELDLFMIKNILKNYDDMIWFYSWAKGQLYDFKN